MTKIEWTEKTWNPIVGCTIVSPGCTNCYAMRMAHRLEAMGVQKYAGTTRLSGKRAVWTGKINFDDEALQLPHKWRRSTTIFVNSMSDLFHEDVSLNDIRRVFDVMAATPRHLYQVLTKRADRLARVWPDLPWPRNVWMGVSVESAAYLERIDLLRQVPDVVRFLSLEPLLGPLPDLDLSGIGWTIVGGESGPGARPMDPAWARDIRDQCVAAGVAFHFKQWGGKNKKAAGRTLDGRTWDELPLSLP